MGLCGRSDGRSTGAMAIKEDPRPRKKRMRRVPDGQAHGATIRLCVMLQSRRGRAAI
jgi:hypothetical protein